MKAMIFAAGLGTRLQPITRSKPKALVLFRGVPLIEIVLNRLIRAGVSDVIINLHHFPDHIKRFLKSKQHFGIRIAYSYEEELLDTGGGLKKARWFFDDEQPFFVHNVDVVSNIDLKKMWQQHANHNAVATLAVNQRATSRYLIFDEAGLLCGWKSVERNELNMPRSVSGETTDLAFCGIHVISPNLFEKMPEENTFSMIDWYLKCAGEGERIAAFRADEYDYQDVGKLAQL